MDTKGDFMNRILNAARCAAVAVALCASGMAVAQDEPDAAAAAERWSVTITPRYQHVIFKLEDAEGIQNMSTYGGTVSVREPSQRFGFSATYLTGTKKNARYTLDDEEFGGTGDSLYDYDIKRRELQLHFEYTPRDTGVTLLAGYHRLSVSSDETLANPDPGESEANSFRNRINAAEVGLRLASRLSANSAHSVSAQLLLGVGNGRYRSNESFTSGGVTDATVRTEKGTGYLGDIAFGYNVFLTRFLSVGVRARAYAFYIDADDADPILAAIPEANISLRF